MGAGLREPGRPTGQRGEHTVGKAVEEQEPAVTQPSEPQLELKRRGWGGTVSYCRGEWHP